MACIGSIDDGVVGTISTTSDLIVFGHVEL